MDSDAVTMVALAGIELGLGVIAYTADGELTPADGPEIERYRKLVHTDVPVTHLATLAADRVFKVMWIASEQRLDEVISAGAHLPCKPRSADFVRSHREVFEYNPCGVSKASGMAVLAAHHGVPANRVAAFGDADNDVPLFRWAGFSVAMPHAKPHVRNQATITAPEGPPETAFARGVDVLLSNVWIQERA
jgi:hydroxymethylpyrimidine pyrophosphatase-like HAD family hydrolase